MSLNFGSKGELGFKNREKIMENIEKNRLIKIAEMLASGVPQVQIAEVMDLSEGRISQIKESQEFRDIYEEVGGERLQRQQQFNEDWDGIEKRGLEIIAKHLKFGSDPDYALRVAAIANRAQRRGGLANHNLQAQGMGERVSIQMGVNFIKHIQNMSISRDEQTVKVMQNSVTGTVKKIDLAKPGEIKTLFQRPEEEEIEMFSETELAAAMLG